MNATVVEFNSLADPVRPAAQNHDLALAALAALVLVAIRRVVIGRVSFELRRAGVDQTISGKNIETFSHVSQFFLIAFLFESELAIAKSQLLPTQKGSLHRNLDGLFPVHLLRS